MSTLYLVTGTAILNDTIFTDFGGNAGTSTEAQRQAAYQTAEQFAIREVGAFLIPTAITELFSWPLTMTQGGCRTKLFYNHLISVDSLTSKHEIYCDCTTVDISGCAQIVNNENSIVDLQACGGVSGGAQCNCAWAQGYGPYGRPRLCEITYTSGIPAGQAAMSSSVLQGLTIAADLALEQVLDPAGAEGGPGDPQVKSFSDTGYSETRERLIVTAFGGSARANYAARMLQPLKFKGALSL